MAATLRGGTTLWTAKVAGINEVSPPATIGAVSNVCVFISNTGGASTVITIQATGLASPSAGGNADLGSATWYDYDRGEAGTNTVTVAAGANIAFDVSPFAPQFLRLKSATATTLTAFVVASG